MSAMLERSEWYDIARDTNWTPSYVSREALFPPEMGDPYGIPIEEWETFDEPYKVSYREYVTIQREKDSAAYSVKAALARSKFYEQADEGWACVLKLHYGAVALTEYQLASSRRGCPASARRRRCATCRSTACSTSCGHTQLQLFFPHELVHLDRQYDWAHEAQHSKNWAVLGGRHAFDDIMMTRDAVTSSIMVSFAFETALTNLQMIGLSTDAANMGDHTFSNLITSIQSDEARHAQLGTPTIEIMIRNGRKKEAQLAMDIALWRVWRLFSITVGIPMDYYIPLEQRHMSFKEFHARVGDQPVGAAGAGPRPGAAVVLGHLPHRHRQPPPLSAGRHLVMAADGLVESAGRGGAQGARVARGEISRLERELRKLLGRDHQQSAPGARGEDASPVHPDHPATCARSPISHRPGPEWGARAYQREYGERRYNFCTEVCRRIFDTEPERYKDHESIVDRMYSGEIDPPTLDNVLIYMGIGVISEGGRDGHDYRWVEGFRGPGGGIAKRHLLRC